MKRSLNAVLIACACACSSSTEGRIVHVGVAVRPVAEPDAALGQFETATGWQVTLGQAHLSLSAIYGYEPEREPSATARLERLLVNVARAHGGYDPVTGRRVRIEVVEPMTVDLLSDAGLELGAVEAEAGAVDRFAVEIAKPGDDPAPELRGHQAWVSGEARRDGEIVRFEGGLDVPDQGLMRRVEVSATGIELDDDVTLVIGVRPSVWLRDAHFDRLEPSEDDAPRAITAESQVGRAWFLGARSPAAISIASADPKPRDEP